LGVEVGGAQTGEEGGVGTEGVALGVEAVGGGGLGGARGTEVQSESQQQATSQKEAVRSQWQKAAAAWPESDAAWERARRQSRRSSIII
jgi:hypothetical protein